MLTGEKRQTAYLVTKQIQKSLFLPSLVGCCLGPTGPLPAEPFGQARATRSLRICQFPGRAGFPKVPRGRGWGAVQRPLVSESVVSSQTQPKRPVLSHQTLPLLFNFDSTYLELVSDPTNSRAQSLKIAPTSDTSPDPGSALTSDPLALSWGLPWPPRPP